MTPGMPVKVALAAYPFQKYGWLEDELTWLGVDTEREFASGAILLVALELQLMLIFLSLMLSYSLELSGVILGFVTMSAELVGQTVNFLRGKVTVLFVAHKVPCCLQVDTHIQLAGPAKRLSAPRPKAPAHKSHFTVCARGFSLLKQVCAATLHSGCWAPPVLG